MSFGKRASIKNTPKKKLDINNDIENKECINKHSSNNIIHSDRNNINIPNDNTRNKKVDASDFLKHIKKNKQSSNILLFGLLKEEKLQLFINNLKLLHPKIPDFWLQKEIDKFKKKFDM